MENRQNSIYPFETYSGCWIKNPDSGPNNPYDAVSDLGPWVTKQDFVVLFNVAHLF